MINVSDLSLQNSPFKAALNSADFKLGGKKSLPFATKFSGSEALGAADTVSKLPAMNLGTSTLKDTRSVTERALIQLEKAYLNLLEGVQVKDFDPRKIETYIRLAEKRAGAEFSEKDRVRLRELANSENPEVIKLIALELRVGIPKKLEKEALAAFGELVLHREDDEALKAFLENPSRDENLKAYVRTIRLMNKVEWAMAQVEPMVAGMGKIKALFTK